MGQDPKCWNLHSPPWLVNNHAHRTPLVCNARFLLQICDTRDNRIIFYWKGSLHNHKGNDRIVFIWWAIFTKMSKMNCAQSVEHFFKSRQEWEYTAIEWEYIKNTTWKQFNKNILILVHKSVQHNQTGYYHMWKFLWRRHVADSEADTPKQTCLTGWHAVKLWLRAARTEHLEIQRQILQCWYLAWKFFFIPYWDNDTHLNRRPCLPDILKNRWEMRAQTHSNDMLSMETCRSWILNANSIVSSSCYAKRPWLAAVWVRPQQKESGITGKATWKNSIVPVEHSWILNQTLNGTFLSELSFL